MELIQAWGIAPSANNRLLPALAVLAPEYPADTSCRW